MGRFDVQQIQPVRKQREYMTPTQAALLALGQGLMQQGGQAGSALMNWGLNRNLQTRGNEQVRNRMYEARDLQEADAMKGVQTQSDAMAMAAKALGQYDEPQPEPVARPQQGQEAPGGVPQGNRLAEILEGPSVGNQAPQRTATPDPRMQRIQQQAQSAMRPDTKAILGDSEATAPAVGMSTRKSASAQGLGSDSSSMYMRAANSLMRSGGGGEQAPSLTRAEFDYLQSVPEDKRNTPDARWAAVRHGIEIVAKHPSYNDSKARVAAITMLTNMGKDMGKMAESNAKAANRSGEVSTDYYKIASKEAMDTALKLALLPGKGGRTPKLTYQQFMDMRNQIVEKFEHAMTNGFEDQLEEAKSDWEKLKKANPQFGGLIGSVDLANPSTYRDRKKAEATGKFYTDEGGNTVPVPIATQAMRDAAQKERDAGRNQSQQNMVKDALNAIGIGTRVGDAAKGPMDTETPESKAINERNTRAFLQILDKILNSEQQR